MMFAALIFQGLIYSIGDLDYPIRYIDKNQSYFIAIKSGLYRMGTPLDAIKDPGEDMPQFSGKLENCSSENFECRSIAYLKFVVPKKRWTRAIKYDVGVKVVLKRRLNGEIYASAICPKLARSGCMSRTDGGGPAVTYQYEVDKMGVLTTIKIQYWNGSNVQLAEHELVLGGRLGLKL